MIAYNWSLNQEIIQLEILFVLNIKKCYKLIFQSYRKVYISRRVGTHISSTLDRCSNQLSERNPTASQSKSNRGLSCCEATGAVSSITPPQSEKWVDFWSGGMYAMSDVVCQGRKVYRFTRNKQQTVCAVGGLLGMRNVWWTVSAAMFGNPEHQA